MSISGAFANARSGLALNARTAELIGSNIANALVPNHARQEVVAATARTGGVRIEAVARAADPVTLAARLDAGARAGSADVALKGARRIADLTGTADGASGLTAAVNGLGIALSQASVHPGEGLTTEAVAAAARAVAAELGHAAEGLRTLRNEADASIGQRVAAINAALATLQELNASVVAARARREPVADLEQARDAAVLSISEHIPITVVARSDGRIALFSSRGAALLDGAATTLGFTPAGVVPDGATAANGGLSGLTLGGIPVAEGAGGLLGGGALSADFDLRDRTLPQAQSSLDALAAAIVTRLEAADASLTPGEPGLLSDGGLPFDPSALEGLAARIHPHSALDDPAMGALALSHGFGSTPVSGTLASLAAAFSRTGTDLAATGDPTARDLAGHVAHVSADLHIRAARAEEAGASAAAASRLADAAHGDRVGVDTDQQLQLLLAIENAYAANARVLAVADAMMQDLLEI